jgi:GT2 family glycosyltransferase
VVKAPEVSVVIPTYRRAERLPALFAALSEQTLDPSRFEVLAIDNFSADDTKATLDSLAASATFPVRILQMTSNNGPAPARNLGWRTAAAPIVVFLDDDCLPRPDWLASGLAGMQADPSLGVLQGRVVAPDNYSAEGMPDWYHCQIIDGITPYFEACNIYYRREALEEAKGFDESFGWWGEDTELGWRVVDAGWARGFASGATVVHAVTQRGWRWYFDNGLLFDNMMRIARDHPAFRKEAFWRPWGFRREQTAIVVAAVGIVGAIWFRPSLLLALPYALWRRPRRGREHPLRYTAESIAVDAGHAVGQLKGAVAHRIWVI